MTIDKSAIAVTENLTDEQLKNEGLSLLLDSFIKACVKRDTPISVGLDKLFFDEDSEDEGFGYFYPTNLRNYINELSSHYKHTLKTLFVCLNNNIEIKSNIMIEKGKKFILITIVNQFEGDMLVLKLPHCSWLFDFLIEYSQLEISCDITFDEINNYLSL